MDMLCVELLLRVLVAHFLADFVFQSSTMAKEKDEHGIKSRYFWFHAGIHVITLALLLWDYHLWPVLLSVSLGHLIIDALKTFFKTSLVRIFLIDQFLHITLIIIVWLLYTQQTALMQSGVINLMNQPKAWGIILAYLLVTIPTGVLIGKLTENWSKEIEKQSTSGQKSGLKNAGKWIGILERTLILTFVIAGNMSSIGFILAAKSVFRFGDLKDARDHKKTEYIIIGTMLSFVFAIGIGLVYNIAFQ